MLLCVRLLKVLTIGTDKFLGEMDMICQLSNVPISQMFLTVYSAVIFVSDQCLLQCSLKTVYVFYDFAVR